MKKTLLIIAVVFLYSQNFQQYKTSEVKEFRSYKTKLEKEFQNYKKTLDDEFKQYKKELSRYWKNPVLSSKKVFVEYSKDKTTRKKVDFEKGKITIDVIASNPAEAELKAKKTLAKLSIETTDRAFENNPVLTRVEKKFKPLGVSSKPGNQPIIGDIIYKKPPNADDVKKYVNNSFKQAKITKKPSKLYKKNVYSITLPLPNERYIVKARRLKQHVTQKARRFRLSPALIYAVIETESAYNPMARSSVPAFGLMQIVPQSAGRDAYEMLYGKPRVLTPGYLYNEQNNILIGSAYLKKLYYDYFKNIQNPISRLYLSIAAYNTGAGNVACAFNSTNRDFKGRTLCYRMRGDYSLAKATGKINSMSPAEVYETLVKNLRYDEARNYLKKINFRLKQYFRAIQEGKI